MSTETESETTAGEKGRTPRGRKPFVKAPKLGVLGTLRWLWRQLTSMRTALFLLLLLAVAAVPGSIFPQRNIDAGRVATYLQDHTTTGPWLDKLGMFGVYSAPWFAAVYILLLISLVGCVLPRCLVHAKALRSPLPRVPKRLSRLPATAERTVEGSTADLVEAARETLRRKGYRVRVDDQIDGVQAVTAEGGRMRETGNLLFHLSLLVLVLAVAAGHLMGWRGDVIVPEGSDAFVSTVGSYNTLDLGPWVSPSDIKPWTMKVDNLDVTFEKNVAKSSPQYGQPRDFIASITTASDPSGKTTNRTLAVNDAVKLDGTSVYLLGNGYAPVITVKSPTGKVLLPPGDAVPAAGQCLPLGGCGQGAGRLTEGTRLLRVLPADRNVRQQAGSDLDVCRARQSGPGRRRLPGAALPGRLAAVRLHAQHPEDDPGHAGEDPLAGGREAGPDGEAAGRHDDLDGQEDPALGGASARYSPGKGTALTAALLGLLGLILSMTLRRRRIFFKVSAAGDDPSDDASGSVQGERRSLISAGALAKGEDPRLQVALDALLDGIETRLGKTPTPQAGSAR